MQPDEEKRMLQKKAQELKKKEHLPAELLELLTAVYERQIDARATAAVAAPPAAELADPQRLAQGAPLLERAAFPYDVAQAKELFTDFLELARQQQDPLKSAAKTIADALDNGELDLDAAFKAHLEGDSKILDAWAERTPEAPRAMAFLVQSSLMPSLAAVADALAPERKALGAWQFGHCPTCGSLPLIGALEEKEGHRHFTCSFCQTDYKARRLGCPVCNEQDFEKVSFFIVEEEPGFRVDVCKSCKRYMKVADFRKLDRRSLPLMDDLASLALDILAAQKGYSRATLSAWGF